MTAATYTSDLTDIALFESTSGVGAYGGGGAGLSADPDFAMEGTNSVNKQITNADKGFMFDNVSNFTIGADDHFFVWIMGSTPGINDSRDNHGVHAAIGDSTSAFVKFHVDGNDTLPLGGGKPYAIRFNNGSLANLRTLVGSPGTTPSQIGGGLNTTASVKAANLGVDAARIGSGYDILNGTGADPEADFAGISSDDSSTSEGIFQPAGGGFNLQGKLRIGASGTACEFLDTNVNIFIIDTLHALTDFSEILIENASSIVTLTGVTFISLASTDGLVNLGRFEVLTDTATLTFANVGFIDFGVTILGSGSTLTGCRWIGSDQVTGNGASLLGSSILGSTVAANEGSLLYDEAVDPDGELDGMIFEQGTAAHHAIEFGTNTPLTITLRNMDFTGFSSSDDNDGSIFRFNNTSDAITLNLVGCSHDGSGFTVDDRAGSTVTIVIDPRTATFVCLDGSTTPPSAIENVRVLIEAADGAGDLPFEDVVTLTQTGGTVTAAHTAHGMADGDLVVIRDAVETEYNGTFSITNSTSNDYDYTIQGNPSSPATGTILASGAVVFGLTDSNGEIADARTWSNNQLIKGTGRKKTSSPVYETGNFTGTISNAADTTLTSVMQPD